MIDPLSLLLQTAKQQKSKKTFWHYQDKEVSYSSLFEKVGKTTGFLLQNGATAGDRLLIDSRQDLEITPLLLGAWGLGMCVCIIDAESTFTEREHYIDNVQPRFIFADNINHYQGSSAENSSFFSIDKDRPAGLLGKLISNKSAPKGYPGLLRASSFVEKTLKIDYEMDGLVIFSSGTTGKPKGIVLSFRAVLSNLKKISDRMRYSASSRIHNALPFHHADGLIQGPLLVLLNGATLVRSQTYSHKGLDEFLGEMFRHQITHFISVPTILVFILKNSNIFPGLFQWPSFQCVFSTAGTLDSTLWVELEECFSIKVANGYGLSETTAIATISSHDDQASQIGTVGSPLEGVLLQVVNEQGAVLGVDQLGEIQICGDILFSRYLKNEMATTETLSNGWLKTGDLGRINKDGVVSIKGRIKNIIIRGGVNICPEEIQDRLLQHNSVQFTEVVGIPDPVWGETIVACIVRKNSDCGDKDFLAFCAERLGSSKLPDQFLYFDALPTGPSGKVQRKILVELVADKLELIRSEKERVFSSDENVEDTVFTIAANTFNVDLSTISLESSASSTLGWDSLGHLNLMVSIEQHFSFRFEAQEMMSIETMQQLINVVSKKISIT